MKDAHEDKLIGGILVFVAIFILIPMLIVFVVALYAMLWDLFA
jgi:hypothetical protein